MCSWEKQAGQASDHHTEQVGGSSEVVARAGTYHVQRLQQGTERALGRVVMQQHLTDQHRALMWQHLQHDGRRRGDESTGHRVTFSSPSVTPAMVVISGWPWSSSAIVVMLAS